MTKRIYYLDFIRAIAICLIIIFHYNVHALELKVSDKALFWISGIGRHFNLNFGYMGIVGVSLFIILSGTSLMLSTKDNLRVKTFFRKRFLSIYPLFWLTYAVTFIILLYLRGPVKAPPVTFLLTVIGLDGFLLYRIPNFYLVGEWFLGLIIIFYVIFPLLRYLFLKNAPLTILICFLITLGVEEFYNTEMNIMCFPLSRLLEFVFGMSFACFFYPDQKRLLNYLWTGLAGISFFLVSRARMPLLINMAIEGLCVFIFLACVSSFIDNGLFRKFIRFVSTYSFGAFLIHHVLIVEILGVLKNQHLNPLENYLVFFTILIISYILSFFLSNAISLLIYKTRLKTRLQTPTPA